MQQLEIIKYSMILLLSLLFVAGTVQGREIKDMAGRLVTVPDNITKVYAAQPYTHVLMSVVAPDLLLGLPGPLNETEKRFVRPEMATLPLLGFGQGQRSKPDMDTVLALHPDIVLLKGGPQTDTQHVLERFAKTGLPVVFVDIDRIEDYAAGIDFTGNLCNRNDRAKELAAYARRTLAEVERPWPESRRSSACVSITPNRPTVWKPNAISRFMPTPSGWPAAPSSITAPFPSMWEWRR